MSYDTTQRLNGVAHVISYTVRSDDGVNYDRRKTTYNYYHHLLCNYIIIDIIVLTEILVHRYLYRPTVGILLRCTCNNVEQILLEKLKFHYFIRVTRVLVLFFILLIYYKKNNHG